MCVLSRKARWLPQKMVWRTFATSARTRRILLDGGWLLFEHGYDQGVAVRTILRDLGYQNIITEQDYAGHDRVTLGQYKTEREA